MSEVMPQMNQPVVVVRRLFDRDGFGIWLGVEGSTATQFAKPIKLELEGTREGWSLPEPTLIIPRHQAEEWLEQFSQEMSFQGVSVANAKQIIEAKNENLEDLRSVIDRLFATKPQPAE